MPGCDDLSTWIVIFLPLPALTICARYAECYISTYVRCDPPVSGYTDCYISNNTICARCAKFCFSTYTNCARLWRPVPGMWIVILLPMPAAPSSLSVGFFFFFFFFLPMPTVPGCDDLCQVCGLSYFYLCQLWRPVPGIQSVLFLPLLAMPGVQSDVFLHIPAVPGCDDLWQVCGLLYFPLYQLWRHVPGIQSVKFLPMPAAPSFVFLTYANCTRLRQPVPCIWIVIFLPMTAAPGARSLVFLPIPTVPFLTLPDVRVLYFCICQLWRTLPGRQRVIFLSMPAVPSALSVAFLPMPTVPGCDDLCQVCELLYFYLCQLWRPVTGV